MTELPVSTEPAPAPRAIYAHYTGGGVSGYLAGLGACDLTRAEWEEADPKLTSLALELKLYTLDDVPATQPAESAA